MDVRQVVSKTKEDINLCSRVFNNLTQTLYLSPRMCVLCALLYLYFTLCALWGFLC